MLRSRLNFESAGAGEKFVSGCDGQRNDDRLNDKKLRMSVTLPPTARM
jgi:hypothetical protein